MPQTGGPTASANFYAGVPNKNVAAQNFMHLYAGNLQTFEDLSKNGSTRFGYSNQGNARSSGNNRKSTQSSNQRPSVSVSQHLAGQLGLNQPQPSQDRASRSLQAREVQS